MRIISLTILLVISCNTQDDNANIRTEKDISPVVIESSQTNQFVSEANSDSIFLDFKIGMSKYQYQSHKSSMIFSKKLITIGTSLTYPLRVRNEYFIEDIIKPDRKIITTIEYGSVQPEFYKDTLIGILISFKNQKSGAVSPCLNKVLNSKYYETEDIDVHFSKVHPDSTSVQDFYRATWSLNKMKIDLISNGTKDEVSLKYWSPEYYAKRERGNIDSKEQEQNQLKGDF